MQYAGSIGLLLASIFLTDQNVLIAFIHDSISVVVLLGIWFEGVRLPQLPFVLTFVF